MNTQIIRKAVRLFKNPIAAGKIALDVLSPLFPDKLYLKIYHRLHLGYRLNLKHPRTYQEKLQWLKLYNRNPEYTIMADKVKAKEWVAGKIG